MQADMLSQPAGAGKSDGPAPHQSRKPMSTIITPTVGRVVWYWPSQQELDAKQIHVFDQSQPLAATVA